MASAQLTLHLSEISVLRNGRPVESPRPMQVGLALQLRNPLIPEKPLETDLVSFTSAAGQTASWAELSAGGEGHSVFEKTVPVPSLYLLDFRFFVYYQNDLGPIVGAALNEILELVTGKIPMLPGEIKKRLHFKIGNTFAEEYGRQTVLGRVPFDGMESHEMLVELPAPELIRGVYMKPATPTSAPVVSRPVTFIEEGEVAANVRLTLECAAASKSRPKPPRGKAAPARKRAR